MFTSLKWRFEKVELEPNFTVFFLKLIISLTIIFAIYNHGLIDQNFFQTRLENSLSQSIFNAILPQFCQMGFFFRNK